MDHVSFNMLHFFLYGGNILLTGKEKYFWSNKLKNLQAGEGNMKWQSLKNEENKDL